MTTIDFLFCSMYNAYCKKIIVDSLSFLVLYYFCSFVLVIFILLHPMTFNMLLLQHVPYSAMATSVV